MPESFSPQEAKQYSQKSRAELIKNATELWDSSQSEIPEPVRQQIGAVFHGMVLALTSPLETSARS